MERLYALQMGIILIYQILCGIAVVKIAKLWLVKSNNEPDTVDREKVIAHTFRTTYLWISHEMSTCEGQNSNLSLAEHADVLVLFHQQAQR